MARSFAEAIAQPVAAPTTELDRLADDRQVLNPVTGEMLDVSTLGPELLLNVLAVLREREQVVKQWRLTAEEEAARRWGDREHAEVVGNWEVAIKAAWSREWDPFALEDAVQALITKGVLSAGAVTGLIEIVRKVDGRKAAALLNRVGGEDKKHLSEAFTWVEKGRPKVTLTEVVDLAKALPENVPADGSPYRES